MLPEYRSAAGLNPYALMEPLCEQLPADAVVSCTNATPSLALFQAGAVKRGQRMFCNSGCAAMGFGLPAALGAAAAVRGKRPVVCLEGDGSLMMNLQELQTIRHNGFPVKLFLFDNNEYCSIRQTQDSFFAGRHTGCDNGLRRDLPGVAGDWPPHSGWRYLRLDSLADAAATVAEALAFDGPVFATACWRRDTRSRRSSLRGGSRTVRSFRRRWRICSRSCRAKRWRRTVMKPDGCFFDLDGTLCDTAPDIFGCWLAALKAAGLETERFRRDFRIGPPLEPMIAGLFPELTEPEREALIASFRELYCTSGFPGTVPYPGIPALLERLRRDGTRLFLATNKALRATRLIVEKQGWLPVFEQIHTPDSTPAPSAASLNGCAGAGRNRTRSGALRDGRGHRAGHRSRRAAGMRTVAVTWGYGGAAELASAAPDRIWNAPPAEWT